MGRHARFRDTEGTLANDERELRLIVERRDSLRPDDRGIVADHHRAQFDEAGRLFGNLVDQLVSHQLVKVRLVVLVDAEEGPGIGNRRKKPNLVSAQADSISGSPARSCVEGASCSRNAGLASGNQRSQGARQLLFRMSATQRGLEVDDVAVEPGTDLGLGG